MKELSIEQKAQRYDEALKATVVAHKDEDKHLKATLERIFPELQESEDEKIRKELITHCRNTRCVTEEGAEKIAKWIAWLEKQGQTFTKEDVDDAYLKGVCDTKHELEKQGKQKPLWHNEDEEPQRGSLILLIMQSGNPIVAKIIEPNHTFNHGERWAYIDDLLEKQGEKKSTDKVEPKFKPGDWISNNNSGGVYQVTKIGDDGYCLWPLDSKIMGYLRIINVDTNWHLWTIEDAKDGDVLVNQNGEMPFIFKECKNNHIYCYCGYTNRKDIFFDRFVNSEGEELHWLNLYREQVYPATKEQRDLLFQKMEEAGYEWNSEKKELKKIEQKPVFEMKTPEESLGVDSDTYNKIVDDCVYGEQKPAWSEDDDNCLSTIIAEFSKCAGKSVSKDEWMRCNDFLNSLRDRVLLQPKQEWTPSNEQMERLKGTITSLPHQEVLYSLYQDLKKLREE